MGRAVDYRRGPRSACDEQAGLASEVRVAQEVRITFEVLRVHERDAARRESEGWFLFAGWFEACWGRWAWFRRDG